LRRVETRDGNGVSTCDDWTADYDALGRRVRFGRGGAKTELHWDGFRLAGETSPSGRLRLYVYQAVDSFIPSAFIDYASREAPPESGSTYYVHHHACGLPLMIEDSHGRTVWWASAVEPYGDIDLHPSSTIDYALRWPGHRLDADLGLFYNRFRDYDPKLARYLQPDPLGLGGGPNLYAYATNPLSDVDLLGLTLCPEGVARQEAQMDEARKRSEHLPSDRRAILLDSLAEIHRRERDQAALGNAAQATEMRGEADATLHMLRESRRPGGEFEGMVPATRYGAGSGMDQMWVRLGPDGSITEVVVIEAKGRNGTSGRAAELSPGNPDTGLPPQMSEEWVRSRAEHIADDPNVSTTERAAARAVLRGLDTGDPPVSGRVITGSFAKDEAPTNRPRRRRSDVDLEMSVPTRPDGTTDGTYPPDGRYN
jgi:RHS repeat-associated protein